MKKLFPILLIALASPLLNGCIDLGSGSSAPPPAGFTATAGDGRVMVTWTASPGVEYWLFTATDASLTPHNWISLPNAHVYPSASSPFYLCGLFDGTSYFFAANGRIDGGPGGDSTPTLPAIPTNHAASEWTPATTSPAPNLNGVGYTSLKTCSNNATSAEGSFAAVGAGGAIFTSTDGKNWTPQTSPVTTDLYAVTGYAANQNNPTNPALRWVAVGAGGASLYSLNGSDWNVGRAYDLANPALRSLTHVAGTFLAVGDSGTILSSTDGITWTSHTSNTTNNLNGVTRGNFYIAVGDGGKILTSADGNTWTSITTSPPTTANLRQVTSFGSIIVAVGDGGTIVTSIDSGTTWTSRTQSGTPNLVGVAAESHLKANDVVDPALGFIPYAQFVAVDSSGNAYTSTNGNSWSAAAISSGNTTSTSKASLNSLVSGGFGYVAVGNAGATSSF